MCGKICYPNRHVAERLLPRLRKGGRAKQTTRVYYCDPCRAFHIGNSLRKTASVSTKADTLRSLRDREQREPA